MKIDSTTAAVVTGGASGLGRASAIALANACIKVAIFDMNEEQGKEVAHSIGGLFCKVDITDEENVVAGFEEVRAENGQERVCVHCAQISRGRMKTVGRDRETGELTRYPTETYTFSIQGILIASYRIASLSALGLLLPATLKPQLRSYSRRQKYLYRAQFIHQSHTPEVYPMPEYRQSFREQYS